VIVQVKTFLTTSLSAKGEEELVGKQDESDHEKAQFLESIAPKEKKEESAAVASAAAAGIPPEAMRAQMGLSMILKASPIGSVIHHPSGLSPRGDGAAAKSPRNATPTPSPRDTTTASATSSSRPSSTASSSSPTTTSTSSTITTTTEEEAEADVPSAERLAKAVALYEFEPQSPKELALRVDDVITVHDREGDVWWFGTVDGVAFGYFPNNYVRLLPDAEW
jgi:hypothetical protein